MLFCYYKIALETVEEVLSQEYPKTTLFFTVCINSLLKFMILNKTKAIQNLPLLYNILKHDRVSEKIKSNIVIGIGDLFRRFPKIHLDIKILFNCLKSDSSFLKKTTIRVLSFLILNDYLKIKTDIIYFAALLNDESQKIIELVNLFFQDLNLKDPNLIGNILPDAIDKLSVPDQ